MTHYLQPFHLIITRTGVFKLDWLSIIVCPLSLALCSRIDD